LHFSLHYYSKLSKIAYVALTALMPVKQFSHVSSKNNFFNLLKKLKFEENKKDKCGGVAPPTLHPCSGAQQWGWFARLTQTKGWLVLGVTCHRNRKYGGCWGFLGLAARATYLLGVAV
jgi:hypothetical protein